VKVLLDRMLSKGFTKIALAKITREDVLSAMESWLPMRSKNT